MRAFLTLLLFSMTALMTGCQSVDGPTRAGLNRMNGMDSKTLLENRTAVYSWTAKGKTHFVCHYDEQGFYWKYLQTQALFYDTKGKKIATLTADNRITARDGSFVRITPLPGTRRPADNPENLPDLVFRAQSLPQGILGNIAYLRRSSAAGGMPLTRCAPVQRYQKLTVPFKARFVFWR